MEEGKDHYDIKQHCFEENNNGLFSINGCCLVADQLPEDKARENEERLRNGSISIQNIDFKHSLLSDNIPEAGVKPPRANQKLCKYFQNLLLPTATHNNIKLLGSAKGVERERERARSCGYIIHPLCKLRKYWDFLMMVMMTFSLIIFPLDIAFFTESWKIFHIFSDVLCLTDIIMNFRTGYRTYPEMKTFELNGKKIAKHYLKTWFVIDLIGSLPFHYIILQIYGEHENVSLGLKSASRALKFLRVLKLLNLIKLLRLSRVIRSVIQYEEVYILTAGFMRYVKLLSMMMLVAHWNGCLHFMTPMLQDFPKGCWVDLCKIQHSPWYIQYGWALFKTLSHMLSIGYGRFTPELLSEAFITIFTMVTGATFYALFVANCMASIIHSDYSKTSYVEKLRQTNEYLTYQNVPENLKNRVDIYFSQKYAHGRYFNENVVLSEVSKPLRDDIIRYTCRDLIGKISFLKTASPEFVSAVLSLVSSDVYLAGEVILQEGSLGSSIYFVRTGELEITVNGTLIETISDGGYFGEVSILTGQQRLYSVGAKSTCNLFCLSGEDLKKTLSDHVSTRPLLEHAAIERLIRIYHKSELFLSHYQEREADDSRNVDESINDSMVELRNKLVRSLEMLIEGSEALSVKEFNCDGVCIRH